MAIANDDIVRVLNLARDNLTSAELGVLLLVASKLSEVTHIRILYSSLRGFEIVDNR